MSLWSNIIPNHLKNLRRAEEEEILFQSNYFIIITHILFLSLLKEEVRLSSGDVLEQWQHFCCKGMSTNRTGQADIH